jgi:hypothetical protein
MKALRAATCAVLAFAAGLLSSGHSLAQEPAAPATAAAPASAEYSAKELEQLVGPIALYPDDLLAIILPASTYPLDVVKAQRFLEKYKADSNAKPDPGLPEPVRNLLNYPDVVQKMNDDLDWVQSLGEAVVSQQAAVMDAIQTFRRKASAAGSLKSDDKQIVVTEQEVIKVVPADPQVIYVPQYEPTTVVVQSAPPVYYPTPYPCYYYPYPPGAAFATGLFFGAMTAWAFNWNSSHIEADVNINRTDNINVNRDNPRNQDAANRARQEGAKRQEGGRGGQGQSWRSDKKPGQLSSGRAQPRSAARPGDAQFGRQGGAGGAGPRPSTGDLGGRDVGGRQPSAQDRGGGGAGGRASAGDFGGGRGDAFGGTGSGSSATRASDRGASSRASSLGGGGGRSGGTRASSGGRAAGGARAGGGARGGGGRRR